MLHTLNFGLTDILRIFEFTFAILMKSFYFIFIVTPGKSDLGELENVQFFFVQLARNLTSNCNLLSH